ncbi:MAG: hypothetical protein ACRD22_10940 [Terriglobia bacterium]
MDAKNEAPSAAAAQPQSSPAAAREDDAIYQNDRLVARVLEAEIDAGAKEIRFGEIYNSEHLLLPDDCEYQRYRIIVRKIAYASKVEKESIHKGRILRGVTAEILGYREQ